MPNIKENLLKIKERVSSAAKRSNRDASDIKIVAATKDVPVNLIKEAISFGIKDIGENKVQEALPKHEQLKGSPVKWHMIGHLQTNKVKKALQIFSVFQSIDSMHLADEVNKRAGETGKKVEVFIEVNTSGEASKYGMIPEKVAEMAEYMSKLPNLDLQGLMTVGPLTADKDKTRDSFRLLKKLHEKVINMGIPAVEMKYLSMGMTDDFEIAIEEGANLIRIGRAIFEQRHKHN